MRFEHSALIQSRLITPEQYSKIDHKKPYEFAIESNKRSIHFLGTSYPTDPLDPTFNRIENIIQDFSPELILIGNLKPMDTNSRKNYESSIKSPKVDDLIRNGGADIAFTVRKALDASILWAPLEPADSELFNYLESLGYSKEEIFLFKFFQNLTTFIKTNAQTSFEMFKARFIEKFENRTGWIDFNYSEEQLVRTIHEVFGRNFTLEELRDDEQLLSMCHPNNTPYFMSQPSRINELWSEAWTFRDKHSLEVIAKALQNHSRIFIVYGASHAVVQEPALRALMENI